MSGQLTGIRLAMILQFLLDCPYSVHGYEERALRAVCFNTWSCYSPGVSQAVPASQCCAGEKTPRICRGGRLDGLIICLCASSPTLMTRICSRSRVIRKRGIDSRQCPKRSSGEEQTLARLSTAPACERGAINHAQQRSP